MTRFAPIAVVDGAWVLPDDLTWQQLLAGVSAVRPLGPGFPVPMGAEVPMPLQEDQPRALVLAQTALSRLTFDKDRTYGLVLGLPNLSSETQYMEQMVAHRDDLPTMHRLANYMYHRPLETIAQMIHATVRLRVDSACATGNDALIAAAQWLHAGVVDDVLVVAASAMVNPVGLGLFHQLKALNDQEDPEASCPFDGRRRGFVMGEGAAAVWLSKHPPSVPKGYLCGAGQSMSATHFVDPPEKIDTWLRAAKAAMGHIAPSDLAYVSAHGTSTRAGDTAETRLLHALLGDWAPKVPVSSVKSMLGHTLGAAALIEALVCLEALAAQVAPPTAHLRVPDPTCDLDYIPQESRAIAGNFALSNAFGFGGHNACVLLSRESS